MTTYIAYHRSNRKRWAKLATIETSFKLPDVGNACMSMLGHGDLDDWDLETKNQIGWDLSYGREDQHEFLIVSNRQLNNSQLTTLANSVGDDE